MVTVERVSGMPPEAIFTLRWRVLREPHGLSPATAHFPEDSLETTTHYLAFASSGLLVGCATLIPAGEGLQLRGMAVAAEAQGSGAGRAILEAISEDVPAPGQLWCNARRAAVGFYERCGWRVVGEEFQVPVFGPHVVMYGPKTEAS